MKYYYANAQNNTTGPVSLDELQALVKAGVLRSDPMVVPEGGSEWKPLSAFTAWTEEREATFPAATPAQPFGGSSESWKGSFPFSRTILGDAVAAPLSYFKSLLNKSLVNDALTFARNAGHYMILAGGVLGLVYCIVIAVRGNQLIPALVGIGFVIALAIGQFIAMQFLSAGDALIANTPHRIASKAFLECCGLFALLGGLAIWVGGIIIGIRLGGWGFVATMIPALCNGTILLSFGALAFNPSEVNVGIEKSSAGEEAVGILGFFLKAGLKLVPIFYLIVAAAADLLIILSFKENSMGTLGGLAGLFPFLGQLAMLGEGFIGLGLLLIACLLPIIVYLQFLLLNLGLEFIRAVLVIPAKLDANKS